MNYSDLTFEMWEREESLANWCCILNLIINRFLGITNNALEAGWGPDSVTERWVPQLLKGKNKAHTSEQSIWATVMGLTPREPVLNLSRCVQIWQGSPNIIYIPYALNYLGTMTEDKYVSGLTVCFFYEFCSFHFIFTLLNNLMCYFMLQNDVLLNQ